MSTYTCERDLNASGRLQLSVNPALLTPGTHETRPTQRSPFVVYSSTAVMSSVLVIFK